MKTQQVEKNFQKIWTLFEETDRRFKETDRQFKETAMRFKETDGQFKETAMRFKETDRQIKETGRQIKETGRELKASITALTGKWGRFVEGLIVPSVKRLFKEREIEVEKVYQRVKAHKKGREMEVDILAIDKEYAVLIEAKSTLSVQDINEHLDRLADFKTFFPEYGEKKAVGAVAGIVIEEGADRYAYHKGLFVIAQSGETVKILNDKKFKPKAW
jgi:hypothetical protein